jgi:4-amino-4-deoxy-L-arabinose transferase-like glycosyltransferase
MRAMEARRFAVIAGVLVTFAFILRLDGITGPLLGFTETVTIRQYHSALLARSYYVESQRFAPPWQRRVAAANRREEKPIEPPLMEAAAFELYRVAGGERLWIPRVLSSLFWMLGAIALYRLARRLVSPGASLVSMAAYLFLPFVVHASRSFQPDPLMIALLITALLGIVRYYERPTGGRLLAAALLTGAAGVVKPPVALFFLLPMFLALAVVGDGLSSALRDRRAWLFAALSVLPSVAYYAYATIFATYLTGHVSDKVQPKLLARASFWHDWANEIVQLLRLHHGSFETSSAVVVLLAGVVGSALARPGMPRALLLGLWAGYLMFGLVFTAHISTHSYYSLPLVPAVALGIGVLAERVLRAVGKLPGIVRVCLAAAAAAALLGGMAAGHQGLADPALRRQAGEYRRIGAIVKHSPSAVVLGDDLGEAVDYEGWIGGRYWPLQRTESLGGVTAAERFRHRTGSRYYPNVAGMQPPAQYFIVTDLAELHGQADLERYIRRYRVVASSATYVIYDLRRARRA